MKFIHFLLITTCLIFFCGCKVNYTFSGASYSADVHTFNVAFFQNQAPLINPSLSNVFTESLKDRISQQTKLKLTQRDGDLVYEGEIVNYQVSPQTIQGNETAALNRLTISVRVKYSNAKNSAQNFDRIFTQFADFESSKSFQSVEDELIKEIVDKLTQDIFNASLVNW